MKVLQRRIFDMLVPGGFPQHPGDVRWLLMAIFAVLLLDASSAEGAKITVYGGQSIQLAIDKASPGDIIEVRSGVYTEGLDINKKVELKGVADGKELPVIDAQYSDNAITIRADGCKVDGFEIRNPGGCGISVQSNFNTIANNCIPDCLVGIYLEDSRDSKITHNTANGGWLMGIGIDLNHSIGNFIANNIATGGWLSDAIFLWGSSNNNTLEDNTVLNEGWFGCGITLSGSCNNNITRNIAAVNGSGLMVSGIRLMSSSDGNFLMHNMATGSGWKGNGIYLCDSNGNVLSGNEAHSEKDSDSDGILLINSSRNILIGNDLKQNNDWGIDLMINSCSNVIANNTVINNSHGVYVSGSGNIVYFNDLVDNGLNAYSEGPDNLWHSPKPITYWYDGKIFTGFLGNRFSDYSGYDSNVDGIGDVPYNSSGVLSDSPLVRLCKRYEIVNDSLGLDYWGGIC